MSKSERNLKETRAASIRDGSPVPEVAPVRMLVSPAACDCLSTEAALHLAAKVRALGNPALAALRHHVTGAIERGEAEAVVEVTA